MRCARRRARRDVRLRPSADRRAIDAVPLQTRLDFPDTLDCGWRRGVAPADGLSRLGRIGRTFTTEAVVLRSLRFSEADRILHLYTEDRGRVGAIAKGVRKTRSRFGGRLEPLSHVELVLHEGRGELQTVTGAALVRSHHAIRDDSRRSAIGLVGAEAVLRLFPEQEQNDRVFTAITRFLDLLDETNGGIAATRARSARSCVPAEAALALRLPAARRQLRRVWSRGEHRRLLPACGRRSLRHVRSRRAHPFRGRSRGGRRAAASAAR